MKLKYIMFAWALLLTSCQENFLSLTPDSELGADDFYQTEEQFTQALAGVYQALRSTVGESGYLMGEMRSDNTHYDYYAPDRGIHIVRRENIDDMLDDSQNQWTNEYFNASYIGIARANTIIDRIEMAQIDEAAKNTIIGQAKFLRAYFYFNLVRYFGEVPLYLNEVTNEQQAFLPKSAIPEIYEVIIEDLKQAIEKLAKPNFPQDGKITKGAASTLLADVYMTKKDFAAALPLLKQVQEMGYSLLPNYADVFEPSRKNNTESIFEIQFMMGDQGQHSMFSYWFIPKSNNVALITGIESNTLNYGGFNVPTEDMISAYEEGDTRENGSIGIAEGIIAADGSFVIQAVKQSDGYVKPTGKTAKPFVKKYLHSHNRERNTDDNWPIYRYSNVLLMLAECLNETGKATEALAPLNMVRKRAGGQLPAINSTDKSRLARLILKERRVEMAFENHRWHDLIRTDNAIEVMNAHGEQMKAKYGHIAANAYKLTAERLIFPIPYLELQLNNLLTQNKGY
ncbi:RagB/SusD family nutrient uptake outer membrane protein [Sphingobacterium shayense]|uniref:RagB/SusD family nutrient uptake outer membrane protein n=1 Tax=Sphingobacterium shayense TaxID=626343 RepID=UPI001552E91B|nr:RagB/SusD family nutrient uptake outer membrane protein [Sphingobacterium shayense]NQD69665.1 RagB/SusD family nutrient uptake outer membrane protein [Sphingobacterium shayense]